jgi:hypothetical protein
VREVVKLDIKRRKTKTTAAAEAAAAAAATTKTTTTTTTTKTKTTKRAINYISGDFGARAFGGVPVLPRICADVCGNISNASWLQQKHKKKQHEEGYWK